MPESTRAREPRGDTWRCPRPQLVVRDLGELPDLLGVRTLSERLPEKAEVDRSASSGRCARSSSA